jgi:hypothetical protein
MNLHPTENQECETLLDWARAMRYLGHPLSDFLIMIPNGAWLAGNVKTRAALMGKMKRRGFKSGTYDYLLTIPCPRLEYHGLWLEMKRKAGGVVSMEQKAFTILQKQMGYRCEIAKGFDEAQMILKRYLISCEYPNALA